MQQVALADDADKPAVLDHRNPADPALGYQFRQILHRRVGTDADHLGRHHVHRTHRNTSSFPDGSLGRSSARRVDLDQSMPASAPEGREIVVGTPCPRHCQSRISGRSSPMRSTGGRVLDQLVAREEDRPCCPPAFSGS
jgi:hypothetical protein